MLEISLRITANAYYVYLSVLYYSRQNKSQEECMHVLAYPLYVAA